MVYEIVLVLVLLVFAILESYWAMTGDHSDPKLRWHCLTFFSLLIYLGLCSIILKQQRPTRGWMKRLPLLLILMLVKMKIPMKNTWPDTRYSLLLATGLIVFWMSLAALYLCITPSSQTRFPRKYFLRMYYFCEEPGVWRWARQLTKVCGVIFIRLVERIKNSIQDSWTIIIRAALRMRRCRTCNVYGRVRTWVHERVHHQSRRSVTLRNWR